VVKIFNKSYPEFTRSPSPNKEFTGKALLILHRIGLKRIISGINFVFSKTMINFATELRGN